MTSKPHSELLARAAKEPLGADISDYSDEWCAGFLAGQVNALEASGLLEQYEAAQRDARTAWEVRDAYQQERDAAVEQFESLRESLMAIESCQSEGGCTRCRDEARDALKDAFRPPESHRSAPYPAKELP